METRIRTLNIYIYIWHFICQTKLYYIKWLSSLNRYSAEEMLQESSDLLSNSESWGGLGDSLQVTSRICRPAASPWYLACPGSLACGIAPPTGKPTQEQNEKEPTDREDKLCTSSHLRPTVAIVRLSQSPEPPVDYCQGFCSTLQDSPAACLETVVEHRCHTCPRLNARCTHVAKDIMSPTQSSLGAPTPKPKPTAGSHRNLISTTARNCLGVNDS